MSDIPYMVRENDGTVTLHMPNPPQPAYPVAHELFTQWADTLNENVNLRRLVATLQTEVQAYRDQFATAAEIEEDFRLNRAKWILSHYEDPNP